MECIVPYTGNGLIAGKKKGKGFCGLCPLEHRLWSQIDLSKNTDSVA